MPPSLDRSRQITSPTWREKPKIPHVRGMKRHSKYQNFRLAERCPKRENQYRWHLRSGGGVYLTPLSLRAIGGLLISVHYERHQGVCPTEGYLYSSVIRRRPSALLIDGRSAFLSVASQAATRVIARHKFANYSCKRKNTDECIHL